MTTAAIHTTGFIEAPKLRLLPKGGRIGRRTGTRSSALRLLGSHSVSPATAPQARPVLLAGGDQSARTSVLGDLAKSMPPSTSFEQASAIWEVLARAPQSKMVILSGSLEDKTAAAVMQMLAHRHPDVPVVCLDPAEQAAV
jgi:hypothetical protein